MDLELRGFHAREIRVEGDERSPRIRGYAAVFDQETELWPGYREVIRPGAFRKSLGDDQPKKAYWNHDTNIVLGSTRSGTLRLWADDHGLGFEAIPPETQTVRDLVLAPLRRGDVEGASFGFRALSAPEKVIRGAGGAPVVLREILEAQLFEVSPTGQPAYAGTEAVVRARAGRGEPEGLLAMLRASGLTEKSIRGMLTASLEALDPARPAPRREALERELEKIDRR